MSQLNFPHLKFETHEDAKIWWVSLSRPEALNALSREVLSSLAQLLDAAEKDPRFRVLVLTGDGEKAFVAGADIKQFESMSPKDAEQFAREGQALFARFENLPRPVIAAVNGFALGGGLELAMACDWIIASESAKFALPECTLGLIPGFGGTVRLPRRIGTAKALEMAMTGTQIKADEALRIGLVNQVLPAAEFKAQVLAQAQLLSQRAPGALSLIKKSIHSGQERSLREAEGIEASLFGRAFESPERTEGVRAFLEKRKPQF
jgi:enoyl-CoA hydratase